MGTRTIFVAALARLEVATKLFLFTLVLIPFELLAALFVMKESARMILTPRALNEILAILLYAIYSFFSFLVQIWTRFFIAFSYQIKLARDLGEILAA